VKVGKEVKVTVPSFWKFGAGFGVVVQFPKYRHATPSAQGALKPDVDGPHRP
jgi:hypothetical protein